MTPILAPILLVPGQPDSNPLPANGKTYTPAELQKHIGGYVELIRLSDGDLMLVDGDGALKGLPANEAASRMIGFPIVGNVLVMPNSMIK